MFLVFWVAHFCQVTYYKGEDVPLFKSPLEMDWLVEISVLHAAHAAWSMISNLSKTINCFFSLFKSIPSHTNQILFYYFYFLKSIQSHISFNKSHVISWREEQPSSPVSLTGIRARSALEKFTHSPTLTFPHIDPYGSRDQGSLHTHCCEPPQKIPDVNCEQENSDLSWVLQLLQYSPGQH